MKTTTFLWITILLAAGGVMQGAHFEAAHEMTYCQSDALTVLQPEYDPNKFTDPKNSWGPNNNSVVSSTHYEQGSEYVHSDSLSSIVLAIETAGTLFTDNRIRMMGSASGAVEIASPAGLSAYAWARSSTVAPGYATGNFYRIAADAGESDGIAVSVTLDYSVEISGGSIGYSSWSAILDGGWAGDDMLVTLNCADYDDPQASEIVHRISRLSTAGTHTGKTTFTARVGDVVGLHAGVVATGFTESNPGYGSGSISADVTLTLTDRQFEPSMADFDRSGKVDIADLAKFASAWLWEKPNNDLCENAYAANLDVHYTGATTGMGDSDVWYRFTPRQSDFYTVSLADGGYDYSVGVFDGCEGNYLAGMDWEYRWAIVWMEAGQDYLIKIYGDEASGNYDMVITRGAANPGNDSCEEAYELWDSVEGTTIGAYGEDRSSCGQNDTHDVWYVFTPASEMTGDYGIVLSQLPNPFPFGGTVTVYNGSSCEYLNEIACGEVSGNSVELSVWLIESQPYWIRVGCDGPDTARFGLSVYMAGE